MSEAIIITVSPSGYSSRGALFDGAVDGRVIVARSLTPFLDGARALLADGIDPASRIVMRHAGSEVDALRSTVGMAAALTLRDSQGAPRFRPYEGAAQMKARMGCHPRHGKPAPQSHTPEAA